jgi:hypothetical protein
MKKYMKTVLAVLAIGLFVACDDWTETESKYEPESLPPGMGQTEEYYANLRAFKATMFDRKLSWGWFGTWSGEGAYLFNSLAGLPDSLDIAAIWGNEWHNMTDSRKKDLEFVQKKKGTRVVVTQLVGNFDWLEMAPAGTETLEDALAYWGWEGDVDVHDSKNGSYAMYPDSVTPKQEGAIRKYAAALADSIISRGLDGYDMDWEAQWTRGSLASYTERLLIYVDELSKFFGPKSGTNRLLIVDGYVGRLDPRFAPYFNLYVLQAYRSSSNSSLNNGTDRFTGLISKFKDTYTPDEIAKKTVVTEDYEGGRGSTGGVTFTLPNGQGKVNSIKGMAMWQPEANGITYARSGGCGAYHIEYEYKASGALPGYYPFMREAIQIMNPAGVQ